MKIWHGHGTEHSANLVMIGHFQQVADAKKAESAIEEIGRYLGKTDESYEGADIFSDEMRNLLTKLKVFSLHPSEIDQLIYDVKVRLDGKRIIVTTDESDVSAFLKILLDHEAKVEVYSAHTYPEPDDIQ